MILQYLLPSLFIIFSIPICIYDIRTMHIPLWLLVVGGCVMPAFAAGMAFVTGQYQSLIISACGAILLFSLFFIARLVSHQKMGWGDVIYASLCGFVSGVPGCCYAAVISCVLGGLAFGVRFLIRKNKNPSKNALPFTPFMFFGSLFVVFLL